MPIFLVQSWYKEDTRSHTRNVWLGSFWGITEDTYVHAVYVHFSFKKMRRNKKRQNLILTHAHYSVCCVLLAAPEWPVVWGATRMRITLCAVCCCLPLNWPVWCEVIHACALLCVPCVAGCPSSGRNWWQRLTAACAAPCRLLPHVCPAHAGGSSREPCAQYHV